MSEPAIYVLIRDGQRRFYYDNWGNAPLFRDLAWGPDAFEQWVMNCEEVERWYAADGGVVVDFDRMRLLWHGESRFLVVPRMQRVYGRLLQAAWPNFEIQYAASGVHQLAEQIGVDHNSDADEYDEFSERDEQLLEAARLAYIEEEDEEYEGEDDEEYEEEDFDDSQQESDPDEESLYEKLYRCDSPFEDNEYVAWVSLIDVSGRVHHRYFENLPRELIERDSYEEEQAILRLLRALPEVDMPKEQRVAEGMWIDQANQQIGLWGGHQAKTLLPIAQETWSGWNVFWTAHGYRDHCAVCGPVGTPMTDSEVIGVLAPVILSTKRLDLRAALDSVGGKIKRTAIKLTGCLTLLMCAPVLLFGLFSQNWKATGITVAVVVGVVFVLFKFAEFNLKRQFGSSQLAQVRQETVTHRSVAGPLDQGERRSKLDELLKKSGLPNLSAVELHPQDLNL